MNVLIVGLGSIAKKHITAIRSIEPHSRIHALRSSHPIDSFEGVHNITNWEDIPTDLDFIVISNPTALHCETISHALTLKIPLFIEKPALMNLEGAAALATTIRELSIPTYIACNLRFHPVILWLKEYLKNKTPLEIQAYCGSNLAAWRPEQDYKSSYSASAAGGGGVHLDLIHELDYLLWLFGQPSSSISMTAKISDLEIDSLDSAHYWLTYPRMRISVLLNYFRPNPKRSLEIVMQDETLTADLIAGTIHSSVKNEVFKKEFSVSLTYERQMKYFIHTIRSGKTPMNSFEESLETLKICIGHA